MTETVQSYTADDVDPDIRRFVEALNQGYNQFADFAELPLAERRAAAEQIRAPWRSGGPQMARTINLEVGGVRLRLHVPENGPALPAMLYIHGGGWTMFSIETHDRLMREYAAAARCIVVGIDYSLSPEAKFPQALDEIIAAYRWLREHGGAHGVDMARIAVGGDSAGANLSVAAALKLRADGVQLPDAMLLNYGAFGPEPTPSYPRYDGPDYMLTVEEMDRFWVNYARDPSDLADPLVSPILADLHGLPPAFLTIAECDILQDTNEAMASRLLAAGVPVESRIYAGATHSFLEAMSISPLAAGAIEDGARWLRGTLSG